MIFFMICSVTFAWLECDCDNGRPAVGPDCPCQNAYICESCYRGYELEGRECVKISGWNTCECKNGVGLSGFDCPEEGAYICSRCWKNYRLENGECVPEKEGPVCKCDWGWANMGSECPKEGMQSCESCFQGYALQGNSCVKKPEKECLCDFGFVRYDDCPYNGARHCSWCWYGFELQNNKCIKPSWKKREGKHYIGMPYTEEEEIGESRFSSFEGFTPSPNDDYGHTSSPDAFVHTSAQVQFCPRKVEARYEIPHSALKGCENLNFRFIHDKDVRLLKNHINAKQCKKAKIIWKKLMLRWHPDKNKECTTSKAQEYTMYINEVFQNGC